MQKFCTKWLAGWILFVPMCFDNSNCFDVAPVEWSGPFPDKTACESVGQTLFYSRGDFFAKQGYKVTDGAIVCLWTPDKTEEDAKGEDYEGSNR